MNLTDDPHASLSGSAKQACAAFAAALAEGKRPNVEETLIPVVKEERKEAFQEFLRLEIEHAKSKGRPVRIESYYERFPRARGLVDAVFGIATKDPPLLGPPSIRADSPSAVAQAAALETPMQAVDQSTPTWAGRNKVAEAHIDRPPLQRLGRFEILRVLGEGGFGTVYLAHDTRLDRRVALKIPRSGELTDPSRFLREARACAQLEHPNIVQVLEAGELDGRYYIASAFVEGVTLRDWLNQRGESPFREAAKLIQKLAEALHFAHNHGIIHRDVKPENVLIAADGQPKTMDFGLARRDEADVLRTQEGARMGTPAYMSPEQASGQSHMADARSDLWALGVMLYELIAGQRPFNGTSQAVMQDIQHSDPAAPRQVRKSIPRDLETIALKCLEKDPNKRYASCQHLADELRLWLAGMPIQARPLGVMGRGTRWVKRHPLVAGGLSIAVAGLLAAGVYWQTRPAYLDLRVSPANSRVSVDGEEVSLVEGRALVELPPGRYTVQAEAEGYRTVEQQVNLIRGRDNAAAANLDLVSAFGFVRVVTDPAGADVEIRDSGGELIDMGVTPFNSQRLPAGELQVRVTKLGYQESETRVEVPVGDRLAEAPLVELTATLTGAGGMEQLKFLERILSRPAGDDIEFLETPLADLVEFLSDKEQIDFVLDTRAMENVGVDADVPVTYVGRRATLGKALERMLSELDLTFVLDLDDISPEFVITSKEVAASKLASVLYPVRDLLDRPDQQAVFDVDTLVNQITSQIEPMSWDEVGGPCSIVPVQDSIGLSVFAPWAVHRQIYAMLEDLRRTRNTAAP